MKLKTITMLDTVEDANEHIEFDEDGTPKMNGGTVVVASRTDVLKIGQSYSLPVWQANRLIELGHAQEA